MLAGEAADDEGLHIVPFSLLRNRSVTAANIVQGVCASGIFAMFYFTSLYQRQVLHYSALKTGIAFVPLTATLVVVAGLGPLLTRRIGVRFVLAAGAAIGAAGLALFARISPSGGVLADIIGPSMVLSATLAQSDGFHLGYTIAAVLMGLTAVAALALFRDEGRGQTIDVGELAVSSVGS